MLVNQYLKYKNKSPNMSEVQIAKKLQIPTSTLYYLKKWNGIPLKPSDLSHF